MFLEIFSHHNILDPAGATADNAMSVVCLAVILSWFFVVWCLVGRRIDHHISLFIAICTVFQANAFMGESIGWTPQIHSGRPVWYIRYISRIVHGPVVLQCLLWFTRMEKVPIFIHLVLYLAATHFSFIGALHIGWRTWSMYGLWISELLHIAFVLLKVGSLSGFHDERYRPLYFRGVKYLSIVWVMNAILWVFSEGTDTIPLIPEMALGALFDLISGPALVYLLIEWVKQVDSEPAQQVATRTK